MGFDDGLADSQAETGAFRFIYPGGGHRGKFLENSFQAFFRDANTLVSDAYGNMGRVLLNFNFDFSRSIGKFNRVFNQIDQHLFNPFQIYFYQDISGILVFDGDVLVKGQRAYDFDNFFD
jgi:hypothetical protein